MRERFALPEGVIYLDGNSLGPPPRAAFDDVNHAMRQEWADGLIRSWNAADWFTLTDTLGDRVGRLIGARPGETVVTDTTSINVYKALHAALALRPDRSVILAEADSFPTDLYMAEGVAKARPGTALRLAASHEPMESLIDGRTAVVLINHVDYRSGVLRDMTALTRRAQAAGALVIWDLCHSVGTAADRSQRSQCRFRGRLHLQVSERRPWCTGLRVRGEPASRPAGAAVVGLVGARQPFAMSATFQAAPGIRRMLCGTQPILSLRALKAALDVFDDVDIAALRAKSLALTDLFMDLLAPVCAEFGLRIVTPRDPARRGSHVGSPMRRLRSRPGPDRSRHHRRLPGARIMRFGFTPLYCAIVTCSTPSKALRRHSAKGRLAGAALRHSIFGDLQ